MKFRDIGFLVGLTFAAVIVHGYHPNAEDAAIYLPGVEKQIWPELFPFNQQFFASHARFTIFPQLIAWSVKVTHFSLYQGLFLWHLLSIFLLLWACFRLASLCTQSVPGRWAAVSLLAAMLTLPVAGTALYIMDQYVNPRNLSAFAAVLAVVMLVEGRYLLAGLCSDLGRCNPPFHVLFCFCFLRPVRPHGTECALAYYRSECHTAGVFISHSDSCLSSSCLNPSLPLSGALAVV